MSFLPSLSFPIFRREPPFPVRPDLPEGYDMYRQDNYGFDSASEEEKSRLKIEWSKDLDFLNDLVENDMEIYSSWYGREFFYSKKFNKSYRFKPFYENLRCCIKYGYIEEEEKEKKLRNKLYDRAREGDAKSKPITDRIIKIFLVVFFPITVPLFIIGGIALLVLTESYRAAYVRMKKEGLEEELDEEFSC